MAERKSDDIAAAADILRRGGLVAFPTETVYGLGADATSSAAVGKIFAAKGRPSTNPLIVHVADESVARRYAATWPREAQILAERFWPGPLTLVLPKSQQIVAGVTAGLDTVGLRVPRHPVALKLLVAFDGPVAAPSANRSGRISPTTAQHVRAELGNRVDLILDGGACEVGIESTVLDLSSPSPRILRPGDVRADEIEALIGPVQLLSSGISEGQAAQSPGLQLVHYSPQSPTFRFEMDQLERLLQWMETHPDKRVIVLLIAGKSEEATAGLPEHLNVQPTRMPGDPAEYARKLYSVLHRADSDNLDAIWVQMPPDTTAWKAVRDRLTRASKPA
jgi:L-threonylcarbamoyladenylate synthase